MSENCLKLEQTAQQLLAQIPPLLLRWYDTSARVLPWRQQPTPYRVWVSEIMLQQTRVNAVMPYYERFLEALPTVSALAEADEGLLLKLWEGLGYYNRVRNMQKAAQVVAGEYGGELPADYEKLLKLPGIGEYTAGAVASIAYGIRVPAVDGNVLRILSRWLLSRADVTQPAVKREFQRLVQGMLPQERVGDFNQALMELGATICLPNAEPLCASCPVAEICTARREGCATQLPVKTPKKPRREEKRTILLVVNQGKVLLVQRPGQGLLAGLWEYLNLEGHLSAGEAAQACGADVSQVRRLGGAKHIFSHIEWKMRGYLVEAPACEPEQPHVWADREAFEGEYSVPSAFKQYTKLLKQYWSDRGQ